MSRLLSHAGMSRIMEDKKMAKYRKLGRTASQRKALLRNQVTMLLQHGKIRTTEAKLKKSVRSQKVLSLQL